MGDSIGEVVSRVSVSPRLDGSIFVDQVYASRMVAMQCNIDALAESMRVRRQTLQNETDPAELLAHQAALRKAAADRGFWIYHQNQIAGRALRPDVALRVFERNTVALAASPADREPVGGIDFNADFLNLKVRRNDKGEPLPIVEQPSEIMNIEGLTPVIIQITPIPVSQLPMLLGMAEDSGGSG